LVVLIISNNVTIVFLLYTNIFIFIIRNKKMSKNTIITESQLKRMIGIILNENEDTYFETFSSAVGHAREVAEKKGYEINGDDWWYEINVGQGRPKDGETTKEIIGLIKDGKPQRKALHIQVYNRGTDNKPYELNFYIN